MILGIVFFGLWKICKYRCHLKFKRGGVGTEHGDPNYYQTRSKQNMNQICTPKHRHTSWEGITLDTLTMSSNQELDQELGA